MGQITNASLANGGTFYGPLKGPNGSVFAPTYSFSNAASGLFSANGNPVISNNSVALAVFANDTTNGLLLQNSLPLSWSSGDPTSSGSAARLYGGTANTLVQRNSVNPQSSRVYNTFTDASNGEWGQIDWTTTGNNLTISTQSNGTGVNRYIRIAAAGGQTRVSGALCPDVDGVSQLGVSAQKWRAIYLDYTNTATVGTVTINKAAGRVNLGAGLGVMVVTNNLVTANSHIFLSAGPSGNSVGVSFEITPAAGSFTINAVPVVTNQTAIDFFVVSAD